MKYECIFRESITRENVHPLIDKQFRDRWGPPPKRFYGGLTKFWREAHCMELNPYASEDCPYDKADCAVAYYRDASAAISQARSKRGVLGLFRILAAKSGVRRADEKPLARTLYTRTDVSPGPGLRSSLPTGPLDDMEGGRSSGELRSLEGADREPGLRSSTRGPIRIGDLLWKNNVRPHPQARRGDEGQASRDDARDPGEHL